MNPIHWSLRWLAIGAVLLCASLKVWSETTQVLAPGYGPLKFEPPAAGSYQLPPLGSAADGAVLDMNGKSFPLHDLTGDKLVVMGFIYTHCPDVNG